MAIKKQIQELQKRREEVQMGGGEKAIEKQQAMGKMTARNRINALLDPNSFQEYDMFAQHEARDFDMAKKVLHGDGVVIGQEQFPDSLYVFLPRILQWPADRLG